MTLAQNCKPSVIPLFGQNTGHSSVPARFRTAVVRTGGQGRPSGPRVSALPLTAASAMAALRSLGSMLCTVMVLVASMLSCGAAHAGHASPATHRASGKSFNPFAAFVTEASRRFAVPEHWIRAVMRVESGEKSRARSRKGATGLMQIMPKTWAELRARHSLGADPYDPRGNILAGAAYIRELYDRYGAPGFLAAYNAGPGRYERHLATGRPLPAETQAYVATLAPMIKSTRIDVQVAAVERSFAWANSSLFAARSTGTLSDSKSFADVRQKRSSRTHAVVDLSALVPQSSNLFVRLARGIRSQ
jgi:soluble lytic murein transglycosylase-like protein